VSEYKKSYNKQNVNFVSFYGQNIFELKT